MIITNGAHAEVLYDIVEGKPVGTRFVGRKAKGGLPNDYAGNFAGCTGRQLPLALADADTKNAALEAMAVALIAAQDKILDANKQDVWHARGRVSDVMLDRLALTPSRLTDMAKGMREVAALPDPVGAVLRKIVRPNGLLIEKTAVPMGVIAIIYESRPNVTSDAAALAIKAGSACILRCGRDAWASCHAIVEALRAGLRRVHLPECAVSLIEDTSHASANELMTADGLVDLLIPRGGTGLIRACVENATVPCIQTGTGICHVYVDKAADLEMAVDIVENAKTSRPSVCNAEEALLVHRDVAAQFLPMLARACRCPRRCGHHPGGAASGRARRGHHRRCACRPADFDTEYLDYKLSVAVVDDVDAAIAHIAKHSTHHSEAIITADAAAAQRFTTCVDSAAVYVNASTRFTDGGEFGLGCEMGISTQKLHARGPMGLAAVHVQVHCARQWAGQGRKQREDELLHKQIRLPPAAAPSLTDEGRPCRCSPFKWRALPSSGLGRSLGHLLPREKASITQKHLRPKTQVLLFYPIFISTGFEIPLTLPGACVLPYIVLVAEAQRIAVLGDPDVVLADVRKVQRVIEPAGIGVNAALYPALRIVSQKATAQAVRSAALRALARPPPTLSVS